MPSVLQPWVENLTYMQQGVILASIRGPDGIDKNHVAKRLLRWLRRNVLHMAFESARQEKPVTFWTPWELGGGSFTGPSLTNTSSTTLHEIMEPVVDEYLRHLDELPHHFQLHFMHAAEVLGYKHPDVDLRRWWLWLYLRLANDMHLNHETEKEMDRRLGDSEQHWRDAEEVTAR